MLDDQGEQLEKFEKGVDQINSDMRLAEEALRSMDLLCGIFPKFWKKSGGFKEDDAVWGDQKVRSILSKLVRSCFKPRVMNSKKTEPQKKIKTHTDKFQIYLFVQNT